MIILTKTSNDCIYFYDIKESYYEDLKITIFPIDDRKIAKDEDVEECVKYIIKKISKKDNCLYIHCLGGHGRTGVIVALVLARLYKLTTDEALQATLELHNTRWINYEPHKKNNHIKKSPQTPVQFAQVRRLIK